MDQRLIVGLLILLAGHLEIDSGGKIPGTATATATRTTKFWSILGFFSLALVAIFLKGPEISRSGFDNNFESAHRERRGRSDSFALACGWRDFYGPDRFVDLIVRTSLVHLLIKIILQKYLLSFQINLIQLKIILRFFLRKIILPRRKKKIIADKSHLVIWLNKYVHNNDNKLCDKLFFYK